MGLSHGIIQCAVPSFHNMSSTRRLFKTTPKRRLHKSIKLDTYFIGFVEDEIVRYLIYLCAGIVFTNLIMIVIRVHFRTKGKTHYAPPQPKKIPQSLFILSDTLNFFKDSPCKSGLEVQSYTGIGSRLDRYQGEDMLAKTLVCSQGHQGRPHLWATKINVNKE